MGDAVSTENRKVFFSAEITTGTRVDFRSQRKVYGHDVSMAINSGDGSFFLHLPHNYFLFRLKGD
jgi:hypothetical protein